MFRAIAHQRKKREIDPTVQALRDWLAEADKPRAADAHIRRRLADLMEFFDLADTAYQRLERLPTPAVRKLARLGDKALRMVGIAN